MKLARLFKKIENFFDMSQQKKELQSKKIEKLMNSLNLKVENKKEKLKGVISKNKRNKIKQELKVLSKLKIKLQTEQENLLDKDKKDI